LGIHARCFGRFGIVDAMYFPMLMRFETYGVDLRRHSAYANACGARSPK
jgi:glutathione S-transferase